MKPMSAELRTLLATRQFYVADVYTIVLASGAVLYYCAGDRDLIVNGVTYSAGGQTGPYWDRTDNKAKIHQKIGVEVDTLIVDVLPGSATVLGTPFLSAVHAGVFDGAEVTLDRIYMPTYGDTRRGPLRLFVGRVAEVDAGRAIATFTINSHLELLGNIQLPRNLYQAGCVNCLGDAACLVDLTNPAYHTTGTVTSATTALINASLAVTPSIVGAFDLGTVTFTSGVLSGNSYSVKHCVFGSPNVISLLGFLPTAPASGDAFTITYGCDRTSGLPFSLTTTANQTGGSNIINCVGNVSGVAPGMNVSGSNIPAGTTVISVSNDAAESWTYDVQMSNTLTNSGILTGISVTFSQAASANGCAKFSNNARFKAAPFIPQPSTAI